MFDTHACCIFRFSCACIIFTRKSNYSQALGVGFVSRLFSACAGNILGVICNFVNYIRCIGFLIGKKLVTKAAVIFTKCKT